MTKPTSKEKPAAEPAAASKVEWRERRERFLLDADAVSAFTIERAPEADGEEET